VQETFLLYELSLAVGSSLDPLENCRKFLHVLAGQKGLTYAAIWLLDPSTRSYRLFYATPHREMLSDEIPGHHFILQQLEQRPFFSLCDEEPPFSGLVQETHITAGAYAIFGLGKVGFLKLFSAGRKYAFPKMEMSQLEAVIHKFAVSLEGSMAFQQLREESQKRLAVQRELEKSNERFSDLFENMIDALVIFDEQGNIVEANKAAKELAQIDRLPTPNLWRLVPPGEIENTKAAFRSLIEKGQALGFEARIVVPDGSTKHVQVNSSGIFQGKRLVGSRNIVRDVTQQKKAEAALLESERRLSQIIDTSLDAVITIDQQGIITEWNQQAEKIFGYAKEEMLGAPMAEWILPHRHREAHAQGMERFLTTGVGKVVNRRIEFTALKRSGEEFPVELSINPIKLGDQYFFNAFLRDISERKRSEEVIRNNQVRMRELIGNLQSGVLLENERREIVLVNQFFCDIFGIPAPPAALIGMDCSQSAEQSKGLFVDPEGFVQGIENRLRNRRLAVGEELQMTDGRILERDYIPLYSDDKYLGHLWQYRDLTEKRRAADAIRKSEEKYRGIIENMELGLLEVDREGKVTRAYNRFCDMTGYRESELIGRDAAEILIPADQRYIMDRQSADRLRGKAGIYEIQLRKKDGALIWVLISGAPLINAEGAMVGSLGIHYDITKRKNLERALNQAKQQAEQARLAERQFLTNMSHEIRTPMNAVIGMTHLLYETPINEDQKELLDALRFSADTLLGVINNILDLSKIEAGELEIEEKPFNLLQLAQALKRTFQFKLREKPVSVTLEYDERIDCLVIADPVRINQILTNLLANASKFTHSGTVGLRIVLKSHQEGNYLIRFEVHDTGIGIPADKIDTIFQNFKQADIQVTRKFGGTGLGLAIVKQLVELMNGRIEVESEQGRGSTFAVELRLKDSGTKAVAENFSRDRIGREEKQFLAGLRVLAVEDNTMNQKLISRILDTWECECRIVSNGQEALQATAQHEYDLILMDIHMPGMDGYEATRYIRSDQENPNQLKPIIALSAAALLDEKKRAQEAGMNAFLTKPFSPRGLRSMVLQQLKLQSATPQTPAAPPADTIEVDLSYLFELSGDDPFFVRDMIETFLKETPEALRRTNEYFRKKDWEPLYRQVHSLKPNLMMLGMKAQESMAAEVEKILKSQEYDMPRLQALIKQVAKDIEASFPVLLAALKTI
jgi:PAS domain S-box-containing protein